VSVTRKRHVDMTRYISKASEMTLEEMAATVEGRAVTTAPVGQIAGGGLKSSIYRKRVNDSEYEVGASVDYAVYVEFGTGDQGSGGGRKWTYYSDALQRFVTTSGMAAQPFLRPALDSIRNEAAKIWRVVSGRFVRR